MCEISDSIATQKFDKFQVQMVVKASTFEMLNITLEKGAVFPEHTSPTDAQLVVLEGDIHFHINGESYRLTKQQLFNFPKEVLHFVKANEDSKFLIVR